MANINRSLIFTEETKVRGMLVPQRSENSIFEPSSIRSPFISMVTVKDPLGFNPAHKPVIIERKKNDNEVYMRNRKLLKIMKEKGLKKKSSEVTIASPVLEPTKVNKAQSMKYLKPIGHFKQNKEEPIQELKSKEKQINQPSTQKKLLKENEEAKREDSSQAIIDKIAVSKVNIKEPQEEDRDKNNEVSEVKKEDEKANELSKKINIAAHEEDPLLSEENMDEEEMNKIIGYISNLDYEKYARDLEIREALQLIKNKMDKEMPNEDDGQNKQPIMKCDQDQVIQKEKQQYEPIKQKEEEDGSEKKLPEIKNPIVNKEEEEKAEEKKKLKLVDQILKCDSKIRAIHSCQSIKKLLEREGITNTKLIDPLRITLIKEKCLAKDDDYISNKLPFLHSLPLI